MKNIPFVLILLCSCIQPDKPQEEISLQAAILSKEEFMLNTQEDSLALLSLHKWEPYNSWFGDDTVYLKPIVKKDSLTFDMDTPEKLDFFSKQGNRISIVGEKAFYILKPGHFISFSETGEMIHSYSLSRYTGESIPSLEEFELINGRVRVKFKKTSWKGKTLFRRELKYDVQLWN
ncbi:MAG: hypothetical protein AAFY45_35195, partial [Bacteroidota bacterium]